MSAAFWSNMSRYSWNSGGTRSRVEGDTIVSGLYLSVAMTVEVAAASVVAVGYNNPTTAFLAKARKTRAVHTRISGVVDCSTVVVVPLLAEEQDRALVLI